MKKVMTLAFLFTIAGATFAGPEKGNGRYADRGGDGTSCGYLGGANEVGKKTLIGGNEGANGR